MKKTLTHNGISLSVSFGPAQAYSVKDSRRTFFRDLYAVSVLCGSEFFVSPYTCGKDAKVKPENVLQALLSDAGCIVSCPTKKDFMFDFGYEAERYAEGVKAYKGCKKAYKFFKKCGLTEDDIQVWAEALEG